MKSRTLLFAVTGAWLILGLAASDAHAQIRVFAWLGQDVWHVTEGDGAHDVKFGIVNENNYPVFVDWDHAFTGSTQGDITDSILIDGITQSPVGTIIQPHQFSTATVEFSPFSLADAGPLNDGWVDLYYSVGTKQGWGAQDNVTVYVSDTPEPATLTLLGTSLLSLFCIARRASARAWKQPIAIHP